MKLALGFDGGGTKTHCVLIDTQGRILAESRSGPSNPMRVGFGGAMASMCDGARLALQTAGVSIDHLAAICAGNAGTGQPQASERMKTLLSQEFPRALVRICTDQELTLEAAGDGPVVVLLAGTGSFAVGRDRAGELVRIGGHGPLLSDEGSAYDVGRRAVMAGMRAFEKIQQDSPLGDRILGELGFASWEELQARAAAAPDDVFPRVFPIVAAAAESGDITSRQLLQLAAADLGSLVHDLVERLQFRDQQFLLVKSGGMLCRSAYFDQLIDQRLREAAPNAQFGALAITPGEAAARIALRLLSPAGEGRHHGGA
ncbi:MAG TPA: BadF/BadG/BcrA/BcrD ATPase family protein [Candidatus Acidoferrum sp.]|jgi:N-acetylglucosamine kinase-like BadF-type ATPase